MKFVIEYGVIGVRGCLSVVAVSVTIERYRLFREINVDDFAPTAADLLVTFPAVARTTSRSSARRTIDETGPKPRGRVEEGRGLIVEINQTGKIDFQGTGYKLTTLCPFFYGQRAVTIRLR